MCWFQFFKWKQISLCSGASCASCLSCSCTQRASCSMWSRALYPTCSRAVYALCPSSLVSDVRRALLALVSHLPHALCVLLYQVARVIRALVFHVPCVSLVLCPMSLQALLALFPYVPLVSRTLRILCANFTICALEFPCFKLLIFYSFPTCNFYFFGGDVLKLKEI